MNKKMNKVLAVLLAGILSVQALAPLSHAQAADAAEISVASATARQIASEGTVLLKNNNDVLPLAGGTKVAIFGEGQIYTGGAWADINTKSGYRLGGGGSSALTPSRTPSSPADTLKTAGLDIYEPLTNAYKAEKDKDKERIPYIPDEAMYDAAAAYTDTAIMFITRGSSESSDRYEGKGDWLLSDAETDMMKALTAKFENVIVIANVPSAIDASWSVDGTVPGIDVDTLLMVWAGGQEGPEAIADVVTGKTNPSGKLADTFAKRIEDYPSTKGLKEGKLSMYTEDIFVGYRYFETFDIPVNYEFGFGLSYTTFDITTDNVSFDADNINVDVTVTNTGDVAGKEVVQVYYSAPRIKDGSKMGNPAKELAAFQKTKELEPGKSQTMTISYPIRDMAVFDDTGATGHESAYVLEAGDYQVYAGNSVKQVTKVGTYTADSLRVVEELSEYAAPEKLVKRLLDDGSYEDMVHQGAEAFNVSATEVTKIEGEAYYKKSDNITDKTEEGLDYINVKGGNEYVTYPIDVEEAGLYSISFHCRNTGNAAYDPFNIYVDFVQRLLSSYSIPKSTTFIDGGKVVLSLDKGVHDLKFEMKSSLASVDIDYLTIAPFTGYDVPASGAVTWRAELFSDAAGNATLQPKTRALITTDYKKNPNGSVSPYYNGGLCLDGMQAEGNWVSYRVNAAAAGDYTLKLCLSNRKAEIADFVDIQINDASIGATITCPLITTDMNIPAYGCLFSDEDMGVTLHLEQGMSTIKFISQTNDFPLIEKITLTKASPAVQALAASVQSAPMALTAAEGPAQTETVIMLQEVADGTSTLDEFVRQMTVSELANIAGGRARNGYTGTIGSDSVDGSTDKYGIPQLGTVDGPAGLRSGKSTYFPCETMLACTFNTELVETMGKVVGDEAVAKNVHVWLAPGMNIHRNPLCGRNFEYFSEDPLLTGKMAAAETRGFQSRGGGVTIKHFCANNRETNRKDSDSIMSERALREIYLRGFQIAVEEAKPMCVMSSYNLLNGTKTAMRNDLLTGILRDEWGFDGLVMTDWDNLYSNLLKEVQAGNNVRMPNAAAKDIQTLVDAVTTGEITRELLENNAKDILNVILKIRFNNVTEHTITASAAANGSITPNGDVTVPKGGSQSFTIEADLGFEIKDVLVNGVSVGAVGSYTFSNVAGDNTIAASFKEKVTSEPEDHDVTVTVTGGNGTVTANPASAATGTEVTLTIAPHQGYVLDTLSVTEAVSNEEISVTGNNTFIMPDCDVTVTASFKTGTTDETAVEAAKILVESQIYTVLQADANSEAAVGGRLWSTIRSLIGSDFTVYCPPIDFEAAVADPDGHDGSFTFTAKLTKGSATATTKMMTGTITRTPYAPVAHDVDVTVTGGNGAVTANPTRAVAGIEIALTIAPGAGYRLDTISVCKTGDPNTTVAVSGSGSTRTFEMPSYDVTVTAAFVEDVTGYSIEIAADQTSVQVDGDVTVTVTAKGGQYVGAACKLSFESDKFEVKSAPGGWDSKGTGSYSYYNVINSGFYDENTVLGTFIFTAKSQEEETTGSFTLSDTYMVGEWEDGWSTDDAEQVPSNGSVDVKITFLPAYVVEIVDDYVAGYSLVLVYTDSKTGAYAYDGKPMYDVTSVGYLYQGTKYTQVYGLVVSGMDADPGKVASADKSAGTLTYTTDVNSSGKTDLNDAVAVVAVYNANELYMNAIHMDIVLKADVNGDKKVNVDDFGLIKAKF